MKILAIRIRNLASLEGNIVIDFTSEPLSAAGLFAITGPTGAGKSTILDALCLALYGMTPRFKLAEKDVKITDVSGEVISQNDVRSILRDGTTDGYAEVDFKGLDLEPYRATWSVERTRGKLNGSLKKSTVVLKNLRTNKIIDGTKAEVQGKIAHLVGLSFEQFTRSVLLAQGDFTAFLKAGRDEKSSLLEKLTGTQVYSAISMHVYDKYKNSDQLLKELKIQKGEVHILTAAEVDELNDKNRQLKETINSNEILVNEIGKGVAWHEQLDKLQVLLDKAREEYEEAAEMQLKAKERTIQLQQIEKVQPIRTIIDSKIEVVKEEEQRKLAMGALQLQLDSGKEKQTLMALTLQKSTQLYNDKIEEREELEPLMIRARELDTQLAEKKMLLTQKEEELDDLQQRRVDFEKIVQNEIEKGNSLEDEIESLTVWKEKQISRKAVVDQEELIVNKLTDAQTWLVEEKEIHELIEKSESEIEVAVNKKVALEVEMIRYRKVLEVAKSKHMESLELLKTIQFRDLESQRKVIDNKIEMLLRAEAHWKLLYTGLVDIERLGENLKQITADLQAKDSELVDLEKLLRETQIERNTTFQLLEKAKLTAAESVEHLRSKLQPDEPCPVCGSVDHPYASQSVKLENLLSDILLTHQQAEDKCEGYQVSYNDLKTHCQVLAANMESIKTELAFKEDTIQKQEVTWKDFPIYEICNDIDHKEREDWFKMQLQEQKEGLRKLEKQIEKYGLLKEEEDDKRHAVENSERQLTELNHNLKDVERALLSSREHLQHNRNLKENLARLLAEMHQQLSVYFESGEWYENWKVAPSDFIAHIKKFAMLWKEKINKLDVNRQQLDILKAEIKGKREQLSFYEGNISQQENVRLSIKAHYDHILEQRATIFNGQPVEEVEATLKSNLEIAKRNVDTIKQELDMLQLSYTRSMAQKEQLEQDIISYQQRIDTLGQKIAKWIGDYNIQNSTQLDEEKLTMLLEIDQKWIEDERNHLQEIEATFIKTESVWIGRTNDLEKHQGLLKPTGSLQELMVAMEEAKTDIQSETKMLNENDYKLRENENNKVRIEGIEEKINAQEEEVSNWASLNAIIGSADGKKFRQMAQEYTLDVLVTYANIHLATLSDRYVLQRVTDTLGLQVLDQDMGNEVRTVFSLSGGESFLVSLALALGLASLSSNKMNVESLFIDEGFGSLDPATLNIAMSTLERLPQLGRKVGVISHVQEMTERINVQIKVRKLRSGKSVVEVNG